jgi:hypothetical protein
LGVLKEGAQNGQAYLAAVGVAREVEVHAVRSGLGGYFGRVGEEDGEGIGRDALDGLFDVGATKSVGIVDTGEADSGAVALYYVVFVDEPSDAEGLSRLNESGVVVIAQAGEGALASMDAGENSLESLVHAGMGQVVIKEAVAGEHAKVYYMRVN